MEEEINKNYLFKSERLGFREWLTEDIPKMADINSDPDVMKFFPIVLDFKQTEEFILKMQNQYLAKGYCYFAVDLLVNEEFIGFIGLSDQVFEAEFTPCVDIGWRLNKNYWNNGYATEGAKRCLSYAFNNLKFSSIYAIAPKINIKSIEVMKKIGMKESMIFKHPKLLENVRLETCVVYHIANLLH